MTPSLARFPAALAGAACLALALAGCGTQVYTPPSAAHPPAPASPTEMSRAQSMRTLLSERGAVARQYWPATSVVMKAVPGMEARLGIRLRFEEALGTFASCDVGASSGLHYRVAVVIEASGHQFEDLGPPLDDATRIAEHALTGAGWGAFRPTQTLWVAAERDGVSVSFDSNLTATESEKSFATALLYFLAGACVPVPGLASGPPGGGSEAGGGPDAGPPPGDVSAGDGLPPVGDYYGLAPATIPPLPPP